MHLFKNQNMNKIYWRWFIIVIIFLRYFPRFLTKLVNWLRGENGRKNIKISLDNIEQQMFEGINFNQQYVKIKNKNGHSRHIRTISMNGQSKKTPVVLVHGFMTGIPDWSNNIANIYQTRPTYVFDLLGFGKSSREEFSFDFDNVEDEYINSIEEWRKEMNLEKMIIISHSFGCYLSSIYAFKYPERIAALIFEDPWGFGEYGFDNLKIFNRLIADFIYVTVCLFLTNFLCQDFIMSHKNELFFKYLYVGNARSLPSGIAAFFVICHYYCFGCSKRPLVNRFDQLDSNIPVWFMIGKQSWIKSDYKDRIIKMRPDILFEEVNAGHRIHINHPDKFNDFVNRILIKLD